MKKVTSSKLAKKYWSKEWTTFEVNNNIQFHWQFFITYSGFWLVNILLPKFDTSSKKNEIDKNTNFLMKNKKMSRKYM